jgi:hypothetical protein
MNTTRKARILKFVAIVAALVVLTWLVGVAMAPWDFHDRHVTLHISSAEPPTEQQAIELSREVLHRVGEDPTLFEPATYDGTHIYARNTLTPSNGYVLWHLRGERELYQFSVHVEQVGSEVRCGVGRCK